MNSFIWSGVTAHRDGWTPLGGGKIKAILKARISPEAFPTYRCGAAEHQAAGPRTITALPNQDLH